MTSQSLVHEPLVDPNSIISEGIDLGGGRNLEQSRRTWMHVLSHLHPKYGGVSAVVPQLSSAIADTQRYAIHLAAFCEEGEHYCPPLSKGVDVAHLPMARPVLWRTTNSQALTEKIASSAGVHIHGLWQPSTAITASTARKKRKPYIISAHGMLEPWALANKGWKKKVYLTLVEKNNLREAACLHALTRAEAEDYRSLGLQNPIAVIPNGVIVPDRRSGDIFLERFPLLAGKRLILFLGRIHFKKGLDILCEAWSRIARDWPDAHLVLAGPDFEGTQARIEQKVHQMNLQSRVTFTGMLAAQSKWSALSAAEFFILPSYSEGLSVSTLEAMGMAKPVLITENCHLPEVAQFGCGMVVRATAGELEDALNSLLKKSPAALQTMGTCGEQLVRSRYSWEAIGKQMTQMYQWLEGGPKPAEVEIDLP